MVRTANGEKVRRHMPRMALFATVWMLLLGGVVAFIAFAGHI
jgi:hypothetical protein